jgi:phospholipid-transporting ATPase
MLIFMVCAFSTENRDLNDGRTIEFYEDGVLIYGVTILLVNLKIFTFTYTNYNFTIFFIIMSIVLYWLILIIANTHELSASYNFYRFLES